MHIIVRTRTRTSGGLDHRTTYETLGVQPTNTAVQDMDLVHPMNAVHSTNTAVLQPISSHEHHVVIASNTNKQQQVVGTLTSFGASRVVAERLAASSVDECERRLDPVQLHLFAANGLFGSVASGMGRTKGKELLAMSKHRGCRAANGVDFSASGSNKCHASGHHAGAVRSAERPFDLAHIVPVLELPSASRVAVDVGCGTGDDVRWLASAGFQVIGIDVSSEALQVAAERTAMEPRVAWVQASAAALPISDESCVLVTDHGCLHHVAADEISAYASEVQRVLVSGGAWLIRDMVGHGHQHRELDRNAIERLAVGTSLRVEAFEIATGDDQPSRHAALLAVLRRP